MANYNIAISVDTAGAIQSLNALKTSLDNTQKALDNTENGAKDTAKSMGNAFGDVAQQLQNFDQGITRIVENFLKLKGVADELLNKSLEQFKKNEQERLSLDVVLNTQGAFGDMQKFKDKILPTMSLNISNDLAKAKALANSDPKYMKDFDSLIKSMLFIGAKQADVENFKIEYDNKTGTDLNNFINATLSNAQQSRIDMAKKADTEIQRLYQTTKFSQGQITAMFTDMISKGIDPGVLTEKNVKTKDGNVSMLDKIVQLGATFTDELGGADTALLEAGKLVHQVLNVASPGYQTDFAENTQHLGTYLDQMITAFNKTPLTIKNIGDVLVRNMGLNQKFYATTFPEFLAMSGKLLNAKSGAETGEYLHAFQRGFILMQQNIDRQIEEKQVELQTQGKQGLTLQPKVRKTAKALSTANLQNDEILKLTNASGFKQLLNQIMLDENTTKQLSNLAGTGQFDQIPALIETFAKGKGITLEQGTMNSMSQVMLGLKGEMDSLSKGLQSLTPELAAELVKSNVLKDLGGGVYELIRGIGENSKIVEENGKKFYSGKSIANQGTKYKIGEQMPIIAKGVSGNYSYADFAGNQELFIQKQLDELGAQSFAYNLFGNDLLLSFFNLVTLGGNFQEILSGIQSGVFTLDESYKQFEQTLSNAIQINEGLMDGMFRAFSNNVGFVNLSFEKLKTTLMSSYLNIDKETRLMSDGATSNVLLILSTIGKVGAIIGSALALSASYSLIVPYLTMNALGEKVGMLANLKTRFIEMIPFLKYLSIGALVVVGLAFAFQKLFANGTDLGKKFQDIGGIFNNYIIPAFVTGKKKTDGASKAVIVLQDAAISIRSVLIGFMDGFSDALLVAVKGVTFFCMLIGSLIGLLFGASMGHEEVSKYIGYVGYALGILLPLIFLYNKLTAITAFITTFATKRVFIFFAIIGGLIAIFSLLQEYGLVVVGIVGLLALGFGFFGKATWGAMIPLLKFIGIVLVMVAGIDLLIQLFLKLAEVAGIKTVAAFGEAYNKQKENLMAKGKEIMNSVSTVPDMGMGNMELPKELNISPDQLSSKSLEVPSGADMIDFKGLPQLQASSPVTVNITLKEAIIEPTSDVFLKKVANTLVPHIQDALNRNNTSMA